MKRNKQQTKMDMSLSLLEETETRKTNHTRDHINIGMNRGGDLAPNSAWLEVGWEG